LAKLHIAQIQAQQLSLGAAATISIPGVTDPVAAKVSLISPALDPGSTTVEVWLRVENPKGLFKAGTAVHAVITGRTAPAALLIPIAAVQTANDGTTKSVMVIAADGTAHKRGITVGIQTLESVQVLGGLAAADTVITTGAYGLDEGTKVKVGAADADKPDASDDSAKPEAGKKDEK
jgi:RND family efflux transporter MFP subunit